MKFRASINGKAINDFTARGKVRVILFSFFVIFVSYSCGQLSVFLVAHSSYRILVDLLILLMVLSYIFIRQKIKVLKIYYLMVFMFPLIKGITIHIGAQWEPYLFFSYILLFWFLMSKGRGFYDHSLMVAPLIIFSVAILSSFFSHLFLDLPSPPNPSVSPPILTSIVENIRLLSAITVFIITIYLVKNLKVLFTVLKVFSYATLMAACIGIYEIIVRAFSLPLPLVTAKAEGFEHMMRAWGTFYEPSQFGSFLLIGLFVAFIVRSYYGSAYKYGWLIVSIIFVAFVLTFSRIAFIAGSIGLLVVILFSITNPLSLIRRISVIALLVVISLTLLSEIVPNFYHNFYIRFRMLLNPEMEPYIVNLYSLFSLQEYHLINPVFGLGNGLSLLYTGMLPVIFRIPAEFGLVGSIAFLYLLWKGVWGVWSIRKHPVLCRQFPYFAGMLTAFIVIMFKYNTVNDGWIWFIGALFIVIGIVGRNNLPLLHNNKDLIKRGTNA